jgi:metal-responsive CopG/Arc/MetJ family transcriptional regulator
MATQVAVRLPEELVARIDLVVEPNSSRSEVIRKAIEAYLYLKACEADAEVYARLPLTDKELALADDPEVWSTAPPW